jgi:hypothetical protein
VSHPYDRNGTCACERCTRERTRRATQAASDPYPKPVKPGRRARNASRDEQRGLYIDTGYQAWDDRGDA